MKAIEVVNLVKLLDDAQVQFISTGNPSITGIFNSYTADLNFLYQTVDKYTAYDLSNHNIEITNIVNVTLYDYIDNFVSFMCLKSYINLTCMKMAFVALQ